MTESAIVFSIIKAGFYKCQSYGQITLNCSMMEKKNTVWIRAPVETKQKNLIAIRVLWLCRNTLLVFKHSGRKETSRWHTKYFEFVCVCVCMRACQCVFVYLEEYGRFPMWHYVDIHDQLICLTSSLRSQMDPLLEPFSNQPPAPAKLPHFLQCEMFYFGKQIAVLDWTGTDPRMEICSVFPDRIKLHFFFLLPPSWYYTS